MIENFDILRHLDQTDTFRNTLLRELNEHLSKIDPAVISPNSFIITGKYYISVSLQHKEDIDTTVTFNIYRDECSIWYAECNIRIDRDNSPGILESLLRGEYYTEDYFIERSKLFSITKSSHDDIDDCLTPYSFFYKITLFFKKKMIQRRLYTYMSFL